MIIIPAIFPEIFEEIIDKIYVVGAFSKCIQIGICDGSYGLRNSWLPLGKEILPDAYEYELDLMVTGWKEYVTKAYKLGAKRVIVHVDRFTYDDYDELFSLVHEYKMTLGLTVSNDVSIDILIYAARKLEESHFFSDHKKVFVQVTGVRNLNDNEHPFDERVISRIRILKKLFPLLTVQVSGRMNPETAKLVKYAGADRLVVGSYIFGHENIEEALENLRKAMEAEMSPPEVQEEKKEPIVVEEKPKEIVLPEIKVEKKESDYGPSVDEIVYDFDEKKEINER